jgi:hypothetical protein
VLATHQPVGGRFGTGGLDEEVVDVGLAVGHIGQAGVGESLGQFVDLPVAVHPAHAFLVFQGAVGILVLPQAAGLADPTVDSEQPQAEPLGGQRQRRMQIQPLAGLKVGRPQALHGGSAGVVELAGVLDTQHSGVGAQTLHGARDVGGEHGFGGDRVVVEQAIGGAGLAPATAGGRNAQRGFAPQVLQQASGTPVQALIAQVDILQLGGQGAHAATPRARRKSAASG